VTVEWAVNKRRGKVFADYNQNVRSKTLASLLSPRAMAEAAVSMPVTWEELESGKVYPTQFTVRTALERLERVGDPWADILESKVDVHARLNSGQASARPSGPASAPNRADKEEEQVDGARMPPFNRGVI
jgi:bifunctional non-homologous end joining protein LigD